MYYVGIFILFHLEQICCLETTYFIFSKWYKKQMASSLYTGNNMFKKLVNLSFKISFILFKKELCESWFTILT
jgi:hypothetical protein